MITIFGSATHRGALFLIATIVLLSVSCDRSAENSTVIDFGLHGPDYYASVLYEGNSAPPLPGGLPGDIVGQTWQAFTAKTSETLKVDFELDTRMGSSP